MPSTAISRLTPMRRLKLKRHRRAGRTIRVVPWKFLGHEALPNKIDVAWRNLTDGCRDFHCPRCAKMIKQNPKLRRLHYMQVHYPIFYSSFRRHPGFAVPIQRWLFQKLGASDNNQMRACQCCFRYCFTQKRLLQHLKRHHPRKYCKIVKEYFTRLDAGRGAEDNEKHVNPALHRCFIKYRSAARPTLSNKIKILLAEMYRMPVDRTPQYACAIVSLASERALRQESDV